MAWHPLPQQQSVNGWICRHCCALPSALWHCRSVGDMKGIWDDLACKNLLQFIYHRTAVFPFVGLDPTPWNNFERPVKQQLKVADVMLVLVVVLLLTWNALLALFPSRLCIFPSSFFMRLIFSSISSSISYLPEYWTRSVSRPEVVGGDQTWV